MVLLPFAAVISAIALSADDNLSLTIFSKAEASGLDAQMVGWGAV
jgi:hypothetical protein